MTFEEYVHIAGPVRTHAGDPSRPPITGFGIVGDPAKRYVWTVAVSGEVWPAGRSPVVFGSTSLGASAAPYPPYRWAMILVDAIEGVPIVVGDAGIQDAWPTVFDTLPSHPQGSAQSTAAPANSPIGVTRSAGDALAQARLRVGVSTSRIDRIAYKLMTGVSSKLRVAGFRPDQLDPQHPCGWSQ
jgi:hypothetical protein